MTDPSFLPANRYTCEVLTPQIARTGQSARFQSADRGRNTASPLGLRALDRKATHCRILPLPYRRVLGASGEASGAFPLVGLTCFLVLGTRGV